MKKLKSVEFSALFFSAFLVFCSKFYVYAEQEFLHVPASIQISSTISDGKLSLSEIVKTAKQNDIKIIMFTDRDFMKWEYGLWPLYKIIKKTVETNSVSKYGIKRYLEEIKKLQDENPGLVLIPGVESAPFYYWEGNPFKNSLKIYDWHKHMLVIGLENEDDYKNLPSVSNGNSLALPPGFKDVYRLWPVLILLAGLFCVRKRKFQYKDLQGKSLSPYSRKWQVTGIILVFTGLLFLFENYPFISFKYDIYHGDQGAVPYQDLIDYVNKKGGLTFWSHPEANYITKIGNVAIETKEHTNNLSETFKYTGFSVFYEGYEKTGRPGGIWDSLLNEYCRGKRETPIFAIGGLSFDQEGDLNKYMMDLRNVLLVPVFNKSEVLTALKEGRMYVVRGIDSSRFTLDKFSVRDASGGIEKTMGQQISTQKNPIIEIKGHFSNGQDQILKIKLIRNGTIIKTFEVTSPFDISYRDDDVKTGGKIYYRLDMQAPNIFLVTNPIFVEINRQK